MPSATACPTRYERHRPELTSLHAIVREHLEPFLATASERYKKPLPPYVVKELRAYLTCGLVEHGFARARCKDCGHTIVVAFSCKKRGVCPSCNARRMCNTAANLVDRVFPDVAVRQWVLSLPFELRRLLATMPAALTAVDRLFTDEIFRSQRARAREAGLPCGKRVARGAAITHVQRFGGAINLNVHFHSAVCDGIFVRARGDEQRATFHPLRAPTAAELDEIAAAVHFRFLAWLKRKQLLRDPVASNDTDALDDDAQRTALDACQSAAMQVGRVGDPSRLAVALRQSGNPAGASANTDREDDARFRLGKSPHTGSHERWNLHAGVVIPAADRAGRERLLRYLARAPISLERLSVLPDGTIAYQLRHPWRRDQTHLLLTPEQFMARLVAIVPPPRHPLLRFHGAFAPNSPWRSSVVPASETPEASEACAATREASEARAATPDTSEACAGSAPPDPRSPPVAGASPPQSSTSASAPSPGGPVPGAVAVASAASRAHGMPGPAKASAYPWRIDWATLLKRVYDIDALRCPCGGRLVFVDLVTDPRRARVELTKLGIPFAANGADTVRHPTAATVDDFVEQPADNDAVDQLPDYDLIDDVPDD